MTRTSHVAGEGEWVRTNETEDVAASVRHALRCRTMTDEDPQAWKWVALSLHAALQGALVCHLVTTASPLGAVTDRNAREWIEYFEASRTDPDRRPPQTYLLELPALVKLARMPHSAGDGREGALQVSDAELVWLIRFHRDIRNRFVHFEPMGWALEVTGLRTLGGLIARITEDAMRIGWAFRHRDEVWREALRADLAALTRLG